MSATNVSAPSEAPPPPVIDELSLINSIQQQYQQQINAAASSPAVSASSSAPLEAFCSGGGPGDISSSACVAAATMGNSPPPGITSGAAFEANGGGHDLGLAMLQSPPPHSYRHSRAYRHFKNPPQPHMCIRTVTETGEELFINVLSWTRIVIPQEPSDPIPLYGGMRVPPGNPRSPPIVFAVMANPEVLKDSGRHSKDPEERRAMVELMCDFVEAMNPGVKLVRLCSQDRISSRMSQIGGKPRPPPTQINAVILKDRDISGELKDVWNAVQAQRDREREEQLLQQRQQQHYHNITTQQMFPKSADALRQEHQKNTEEQMSNPLLETFGTSAPIVLSDLAQHLVDNKSAMAEQQEDGEDNSSSTGQAGSTHTTSRIRNNAASASDSATELCSNQCDGSVLQNGGAGGAISNDQIDASHKPHNSKNESTSAANVKSKPTQISTNASSSPSAIDNPTQTAKQKNVTSPTSSTNATTTATVVAASSAATTPPTSAPSTVTPITPPTKKEKLGGFLPNGCIFPRFKNNKHKDKDKEKESKSKDKEKTLLNALKKSKDKKAAPTEQQQQQQIDKTASTVADAKSQYERNCINLEGEVQKLDLNKIDMTTSNDNMFIKLKVAATSAAAK